MLGFLDNFFLQLEGKSEATTKAEKPGKKRQGLGSLIYSLFVSKEYQNRGLSGWKDDKEKFKIDLVNDIKTFLFAAWEKPWIPGLIFDQKNKVISGFRNISGRVYHNNSNIISLEQNCGESPYFITLSKLAQLGGKILDKSKITSIISYIPIYKDEKTVEGIEDGKPDFMLPRFHGVINVDFTEGIKKPAYKTIDFQDLELNEYVESFLEELKKRKRIPKLIYDQADGCHYKYTLDYSTDEIHMVQIKQFKGINSYYSTLFHEIIHSTKATTRFGARDKKTQSKLEYANEELVAEMGAMIICSELGLEYNRQNSLVYLKGWLKDVKGNADDAMIEAYAFACDAADYLLADIDLPALVPDTMTKRAELSTPEPVTAKPDSKNRIPNNGGETKPKKEPKTKAKKETKKEEPKPADGRNTASSSKDEGNPAPKFKIGDKVSRSISNSSRREVGRVQEIIFEKESSGWFGHKAEHYYRLRGEASFIAEHAFTLEEEAPKDYKTPNILPKTEPKELDYELARRAHMGTSFDPEKRAKSHQAEFANSLNAYAEDFEDLAKTDEQKELIKAEFARFKEGYKSKYTAWLHAKSRCISSMITGGSNFPVKRAEKANQSEHNRFNELTEFESKAEKAIKNKIKGLTPQEAKDAEAWRHVEREVMGKLAALIQINKGEGRGMSKPLFVSLLKGFIERLHKNRQYTHVNKALALVREVQEKYNFIVFSPKNAVWKLENTAPEEVVTPTGTDEIYTADGCKVENNRNDERVRIFMDEKPNSEQITYLKKHGFKWSPFNKAWQRQNTPNGISEALRFAKQFYPSNEPTPEPEKPSDEAREWSESGFNEYFKSLKVDKIRAYKNKEVARQDYHLSILRDLFETESKKDFASKGINKQLSDINDGILRNTLSVYINDSYTFDYVTKKIKERYEEAKVKGKKIPEFVYSDYPELNPNPTNDDNEPNFGIDKLGRKTSNKIGIVDFPIKNIYTDEKRFQNRKNAFSEDSKNRIIKAFKTFTFDWAKFDPITLWKDKNGKVFVISGHSRLAAFKELFKQGYDYNTFTFHTIPARFFEGTEAQAIDLALNSNTLSTKETDVERAMYYNRQRETCEIKNLSGLGSKTDCEKQVEQACREAEGKNANFILNLSYLNPQGNLIDTLSRLGAEKDNDSTNVLRTVANWIGEARRNNPAITNEQESEIAKFLLNGGYGNKTGQFRNKAQFNERLDYSFNKWKARGSKPGDALNLANTLSKSPFEKDYDERVSKAKADYDAAIADHEEKHKKYLILVMNGQLKQQRMDELMKPIVGYVERTKKEYDRVRGQKDEVKKAAEAQTSLFGLGKITDIQKPKTTPIGGEIGKFLGEYERNNYSIVLRGDKGAGKSRLLYQLINAFAGKNLKCAVLSLEMAKDSSVSTGYRDAYISLKNMENVHITDERVNYEQLNEICKHYNIIAINS